LSGLIFDPAGNLYGTTSNWNNPQGEVFEPSPSGGTWTEQLIYAFDNDISSGFKATAGLTMDAAGGCFLREKHILCVGPGGAIDFDEECTTLCGPEIADEPPDVWAAFVLRPAESGSDNCRNQL
jgi:hypothetical protein